MAKVKVKILKPVSCRYNLSANIGENISVEKKQADEMISNGDAKKA